MLNVLLILLNILLYTSQTLLFKFFSDRYKGDGRYLSFVYSALCGIIAGFVSFAVGGFSYEFNPVTFLLASINAVGIFIYYLFLYQSTKNGPYSIVMVFGIAGGISVPVLTSAIALGEIPSIWKVLCFLIIFVSCYFVSKKPGEDTSIPNKKKFFISCIIMAITNGVYGGVINLQQAYTGDGQKAEMLTTTFILSSVISFLFLFIKNKKETPKLFKFTKSAFIYLIAASLSASFAVNMLVLIAKYIDVNLLWTFNNSGVLVFSILASAILLKEKLSVKNIIGCSVIAITLIVISFV